MLACRDVGSGKLPEPETLLNHIARSLARKKDPSGVRVTVTAGPTQESLDPVRYLTNHSSGRMGYAIARGSHAAWGAGDTDLWPDGTSTCAICCAAASNHCSGYAAGGSDSAAGYRYFDQGCGCCGLPAHNSGRRQDQKTGWRYGNPLGAHRGHFELGSTKPQERTVCMRIFHGDRDLLENSRKKLESKRLDMIVANNLKVEGAGFWRIDECKRHSSQRTTSWNCP